MKEKFDVLEKIIITEEKDLINRKNQIDEEMAVLLAIAAEK